MMLRKLIAAGITTLMGLWLALSPFVFGFVGNTAALLNNLAAGLAVIVFALAGIHRTGAVKGMIVVLGAWVFASAFLLGDQLPRFTWNNTIVSFLLVVCGVSMAGRRKSHAHSWRPAR